MEIYLNRAGTAFIFCLPLFIAACGGGSGNNSTSGDVTPPNTLSATKLVENLESSGQIPKLDRGQDLKGPDTDGNGIRDDIDAFLKNQNFDAPKMKAAQQSARIYQSQITVNIADKPAIQALETKANSASKCLADKFGKDAPKVSQNLEKLTANTKERVQAYLAYDKAQNGTVASIPEGDVCE